MKDEQLQITQENEWPYELQEMVSWKRNTSFS